MWQRRHERLPPRRHACLLRYGILAALRERDSVDRRIASEDHLRQVNDLLIIGLSPLFLLPPLFVILNINLMLSTLCQFDHLFCCCFVR